jgi:fructan beta-fructosidase
MGDPLQHQSRRPLRRIGDTSFSADFPAVTKAPTRGKMKTLRLFVDKSSVEAFDAEGKMAMTNCVFPSEPYSVVR